MAARRIKGARDFWSGVALIAMAVFVLIATADLPGMHGFQFGPGTAPRLFSIILLFLGVALSVSGLIIEAPLERYYYRGGFFVALSAVFFALSIKHIGFVLSVFFCFIISSLGYSTKNLLQVSIIGILLTISCSILFPYVLGLPFDLFPRVLIR
jgi:putative tricarboxylic transport membrane protein